jgi:hypothetical protein
MPKKVAIQALPHTPVNPKEISPGKVPGKYLEWVYDSDHAWRQYPAGVTAPGNDKLFNFDVPLVGKGSKRGARVQTIDTILVLDNYGDETLPDEIREEILGVQMFRETIGIRRVSGEIVRVGFIEEREILCGNLEAPRPLASCSPASRPRKSPHGFRPRT